MSKRLQVILDDREFADLKRVASEQGLTVSEWVRQSLRRVGRQTSDMDSGDRLAAVRAGAGHSFPTADVDQVLAEIEQGYVT